MSVAIAYAGIVRRCNCAAVPKKTRMADKHDDCWRWRQFMMEQRADGGEDGWRRARIFDDGCCGSRPGGGRPRTTTRRPRTKLNDAIAKRLRG